VISQADVLGALDGVRDPELDEPVTSLGFVESCVVSPDGAVRVRLRLPTYFCAPNFAFLMVADAYDAVTALPGVSHPDVQLVDHFTADAINSGVAARSGFVESFDGEAVDELDSLRRDFIRKAVLAGTDRVCRSLLEGGAAVSDLAGLTLGDVPWSSDLERLRARRSELGLPSGDGDPLLVDAVTGERVSPDSTPAHLHRTRLTRVSVEANGGVCRGLLHERYPASAGLGQREE